MTLTLYKGRAAGKRRKRRRGAGRDDRAMRTQTTWEYFGLPPELEGRDVVVAAASRNGQGAVTAVPRRRWWKRDREPGERDRAAVWLRVAMVALGLLAAT